MVGGAIASGFRGSGSGVGSSGGYNRSDNVGDEGTGVQSPRASRRVKPNGASPEEYDDRYTEQSNMRRNDTKRRTIDSDEDRRKMSDSDYKKRREDIDRKTRSGMNNISGNDRTDRYNQDSHRAKDIGDSRRFRSDD